MSADLITTEYLSDLLVFLDHEKLKEDLIKAYGSKENISSRILALASKAHVQKTFFYTAWDQMLKTDDETLKDNYKKTMVSSLERLKSTVTLLKEQDPCAHENYTFALCAVLEGITHMQEFLVN